MFTGSGSEGIDRGLTVGQAAQFLGVSPSTLRNWDHAGRLKPVRHPKNGYRIYRQEQLLSILGQQNAPGTPGDRLSPTVQWPALHEPEHCVQFYETDAFLMDAVSEFLAPALAEGEGCIIIATESHRRGIERRLRARGMDLPAARVRGQYVALDAAQTLQSFMVDGAPDSRRFLEVVGGVVRSLATPGRCPRAFGEMVALLWKDGLHAEAIRLEEMWNGLRKSHTFSLLCGYPMEGFVRGDDSAAFGDVCGCHARVMPAESYSALPTTDERMRAITMLQQKAAALQAEIAHRREVEKALSERERELCDFLENAVEGLHQVGPEGTILWANQAEMNLLGYGPEEYIGRHIADFHVDREVLEDMLNKLRQGETLFNYPARLRCKDGSIRHVLVHSNARFADGKLLYTRCFTRDVTDQERAEARLAAIVASSDDAIVSKALDGTILSWNKSAERLFGYSQQEVIGKHITMIIPRERVDEERMIVSRLTRGEHVEHFETVRLRKDGNLLDVSIAVAPVRDSTGKIIGASKIARDISERRRVENELRLAKAAAEQANKTKDQFLAVLSHELRTPLTPVLLTVELLATDPALPPHLAEQLAMIRRNVSLETRLIDDLLDLSRVMNGKMPLEWQALDLHPLIESVAEMVRADCEQKRLRVDIELKAQQQRVSADAARLQQVLWNLLKNAVKFTPEGGQIRIATRDAGPDRLIVDVEDSGMGIDPQSLAVIFEPFEQGEEAVNRRCGGLGLGLAIAKAIVTMHEGTIAAQSDGLGRGARFSVELPALVAANHPNAPAAPARRGNGDVAALRILLVDDHADTLRALQRLLKAAGHDVLAAACVADARRAVEDNSLDILISDIGLPDGTGLQVIQHARARHPHLRGIALTGYGMKQDVQRSEQAGFNAHLTKPVDLAQLEATIRRLASTVPAHAL